jgi:nucleotide-binding universal stress UspA family protein
MSEAISNIKRLPMPHNKIHMSICRINIIGGETKGGAKIKRIINEGDPVKEILKVIGEEEIDLVISAHEEGRIERLLVGSINDAIIRQMPCSIFLVKNELEPAAN